MSKLKSCLEDLSNEIFMEIFDYLYGQQIYSSFSTLNHRFNLLCYYYPKLYIDATDRSLTRKKFRLLRYSILSKRVRCLKFSADKWISLISGKYFSSLHSLIFINSKNPTKIKKLLEKLPSHNQLHYLSIHVNTMWYGGDVQDLVTTIFKLPNLNRLEFNVHGINLGLVRIVQPLLSLRHFSVSCYDWRDFLPLVSFMPNLISLDLSANNYYVHSIFIQPNSLSKLKILRISNIRTYREINDVFQLCPQLEIFQIQCNQIFNFRTKIKPEDWENLLISMKFLKRIEINVHGVSGTDVINVS